MKYKEKDTVRKRKKIFQNNYNNSAKRKSKSYNINHL